jgi:hypothetical protein
MYDYFKNKYKDGIRYEPGATISDPNMVDEDEDKKLGKNLT